ncbi:MAG: ExbD/TolR family protein [Paracoccaceae bacterium]
MSITQNDFSLGLPQTKRRYSFALTPLADAMFQLLIFFMLSSSLTPYSLLTIRSGATGEPGASSGGASGEEPAAIAADAAIWQIANGQITAGGQSFEFEMLPDLAKALKANNTAQILLIAKPGAQVQDLATVLEALTIAGVTGVQLASTEAP